MIQLLHGNFHRWKTKNTLAAYARNAFTLTEVAIVLAVGGLITGAIWGVANTVWENSAVSNVVQQAMKTTGNIRDQYNGIQSWPAALQGDETTTFDGLNLLPIEMRTPTAGAYQHALSGSFHVLTLNAFTTIPWSVFEIQLQGLKSSACIKLLMQTPFNDASVGFVDMQVIGSIARSSTITNGVAGVGGVTPMLITTASTWCDGTARTNEIDLYLKLHN